METPPIPPNPMPTPPPLQPKPPPVPAYQPHNPHGSGSKDWLTTLLLCLFVGGFGVHRFYTGFTPIGLIQLFTAGGCGIWHIIDTIQILMGNFVDSDGNPLTNAPQQGPSAYSASTTLLLSFFLGIIGAHRFYTGQTGKGLLMLLTFGGCGIWTFIDFIMLVTGSFKDGDGNLVVVRQK